MDNQHRKISGYRELSQTEIDLMNRIKAFGPSLQELIQDISKHLNATHNAASGLNNTQVNAEELYRITGAQPYKWLDEGEKNLQIGLMCVTRAVAQPSFF